MIIHEKIGNSFKIHIVATFMYLLVTIMCRVPRFINYFGKKSIKLYAAAALVFCVIFPISFARRSRR